MSVVNLTEVLVAPARDGDMLAVAREAIDALGVSVHQPNEAVGVEASRLRGRFPISLPDAYCLATAKHAGATLVSFHRKVLRAAEAEAIRSL
jgi:predicted nucleic acid-binding protein